MDWWIDGPPLSGTVLRGRREGRSLGPDKAGRIVGWVDGWIGGWLDEWMPGGWIVG